MMTVFGPPQLCVKFWRENNLIINNTTSLQTPLEKILQSNGKLTEIIYKSGMLKKFELLFQTELSKFLLHANPDLINAIHVTDYEKGRLQLLCDNAAISTRLRYLLPELILQLREQHSLSNLTAIDLKIAQTVVPPLSPPQSPPLSKESLKKINLSPRSSALLKSTLDLLKNH